jgi:hypothetical protein
VIPALAPYFVLAGVGTMRLITRRYFRPMQRVLVRVVAGLALILLPGFYLTGASLYATDVQSINGEMVEAAHWIAENVPPDKLFATHDIGAIGYFAPRALFDLAGLVSPEVVPIITDWTELTKLMEQRGVGYLMVSDEQSPFPPKDPRLCQLFETAGRPSPLHMKVYRIAWDGRCTP